MSNNKLYIERFKGKGEVDLFFSRTQQKKRPPGKFLSVL